jgi:hypothetical protein
MSGSRKTPDQRLNLDDVRSEMGASGNLLHNAGRSFQPMSAEEEERQRMLVSQATQPHNILRATFSNSLQDDLGLHRVEELPMEDEPRGHRGHDNRGHANRGRDNRGHDQRYHAHPPTRAAVAPAQDAVAAEMANVWRRKHLY